MDRDRPDKDPKVPSGKPDDCQGDSRTIPADSDRKHTPISSRLGRSIQPAREWSPGMEIIDGYRIISVLGKGGMGIVYLVEMPLLNKTIRYAVKTLLSTSEQQDLTRRLFLRELRTWIDLPPHPNIVRCHFFRTVEDKLAIFSEYIDGGSLHERVRRVPALTLPDILDLAIQSALGLLTAHRHGVIHQDVKPANILITKDGIAKITDFGLARAFTPKSPDPHSSPSTSGTASCDSNSHGMTPLYCSYEQAAGLKVDYRTDIWSWGLTVLELLCSGAFWRLGSMAPLILDTLIAGNAPGHPYPTIPSSLIDLLRKCFQEKKSLRWQSFKDIIVSLLDIYRESTGTDYRRTIKEIETGPRTESVEAGADLPILRSWQTPSKWIERLRELHGVGSIHIELPSFEHPSSIRAAALADLDCYDAIQIAIEKHLSATSPQHQLVFAEFLLDRARIHRNLADYPGAQICLTSAIAASGFHDSHPPSIETVVLVAEILSTQFQNLKDQNEFDEALVKIDELISILSCRITESLAIPGFLGRAYRAKASLISRKSGYDDVERIFDQGQSILEDLVFTRSLTMHATELAKLYATRATFLSSTGHVRESIGFFDRAAKIWEPMMRNATPATVVDLINVYRNKAIALRNDRDFASANPLFHRVSSMFEDLVYQRGRLDMLNELAISCMNEANGLCDVKRYDAASRLFDRAIEITERLFFDEGRTELVYHLALEYNNKAVAISDSGKPSEAIPLYERALDLYENLVFEKGLVEHRINLAFVHENLGTSFGKINQWDRFEFHFDRYESIVQTTIESNNRLELYENLITTLCDKMGQYRENGFHTQASELKKRVLRLLEENVPEMIKSRLDSLHPEVRLILDSIQ